MALISVTHFLSTAGVLIFFQNFPVVFDLLCKLSAIFALIAICDVVKNLLRKNFLNKRISSKNKAVLITGCDSGFGHLLAQRLDHLGFHVFASCLFPSGEGAQDLKSKTSSNLQILELDVTKDADVHNALKFVKQNLKDHEVLWTVVNNAGIGQAGEIEWTPVQDIQRIFDINAIGVVRVTKAFLPLLRKSKGRVVNTTSFNGRVTSPGYVSYCMSKAAAVSFTNGLRMEMVKFGVKVISIEPFFFKTPITETERLLKTIENAFEGSPEDIKEAYGKKYLKDFKWSCKICLLRSCENVEQVIDCFEDAIMAEEPQRDYFPCYLPHKVIIKILKLFPQAMTDTIQNWFFPSLENSTVH